MTDQFPYKAPSYNGIPELPPKVISGVTFLRIITVSLLVGPVFFTGVALAVNEGELGVVPDTLAWVAIAISVLDFALHFILPNLLATQQLDVRFGRSKMTHDSDCLEKLFSVYRLRHLVGCAMLEAAVFLNVVAYLTSKFAGNLVAALFLLIAILLKLPTGEHVAGWLNDASQQIDLN